MAALDTTSPSADADWRRRGVRGEGPNLYVLGSWISLKRGSILDWPRRHFVAPGSARQLAYNFAELDGSMERFLEFEAAAEREKQVNLEEELARKEAEEAAQRQHEEIEP